MPRALEALYLKPLRREAEFGVPSCDLQLRSYSVRNLEFFCDFALRAAYFLGLPAFGPVPLPRLTQRWTVPKSTFIFKKSQENFERITLRRLIQIRDGNPESVQLWLAFLQKHAYYGIGMKANVWEFSKLGMLLLLSLLCLVWSMVLTHLDRRCQGDGQERRADGEAAGGQVGAPELRGAAAGAPEGQVAGPARAAAGGRGPGAVRRRGEAEDCGRPVREMAARLLSVLVSGLYPVQGLSCTNTMLLCKT
jgi:ribosomal protein S10